MSREVRWKDREGGVVALTYHEARPKSRISELPQVNSVRSIVQQFEEAMSEADPYRELAEYLQGQNLSEEEIGRVIARVQEYDLDTRVDSIMDSVASGDLNLQAVIDEALKNTAD